MKKQKIKKRFLKKKKICGDLKKRRRGIPLLFRFGCLELF